MAKTEFIAKTPEEIEKEAKQYPIVTFADILRALKEHPDWLLELRKLILTEELLELPKKVEELLKRVDKIEKDVETLKQDVAVLKQDVAVLKQDVAVLKQDVAVLKQDVAVLKQDVDILKKDMSYLKGEFGRFKGREFERTIRERYYAYFSKLLRRSKRIELEAILSKIEDALDEGLITEEQYESLLNVDLLVEGLLKETRKPIILAVEISYSVYEEDLKRAMERANILAHILKKEVIPTVVGVEVREEILEEADRSGIFLIKTNYS